MDLLKYGFNLYSDFEIRIIYEDDNDLDLFIPLGNRTLNIFFNNLPEYLNNRFQLNDTENMIIRISKKTNNTLSTFHFLRKIDIKSSTLNFIIDYKELSIILKEDEFNNNLFINS